MSVESSNVLFPRFQQEFGDLLSWRAQPKPWLGRAEVETILNPRAVAETIPQYDTSDRWWGVYHYEHQIISQRQDFRLPKDGRPVQYRSRLIEHHYLWDEQAVDGSAYEVVLERRNKLDMAPRYYPEIALLMRESEGRDSQRLVVSNPAGFENWVEPATEPNEINDSLDFSLLVLSELATRQAAVRPVDIA